MTDRRLLALVLGALLAVPATAAAATRSQPVGVDAAKPYFDSRASDRSRAARAGATVAAARPSERTRSARSDLKRGLGRGGVVTIDPLSGTPRQLLRTDGALSGPRGGARTDIARDFVRANRSALGLDAADLDGLDLDRRATTPDGLTVVHFRQLYRGIPAFDNDLRVAIDRAGRVLSVAGAPRHDLAVESVEPSLSGAEALARLQRNVGVERSLPVRSGPAGARRTTTFAGDDFARLILFGTASGAKLAWHVTYRATSTAFYDAVVDANSGAILYRQNLTKADGLAEVYPNHPGASVESEDLQDFGLPAGSTRLDGEFSRQWADLNDNDDIETIEETTSSGTNFVYEFTPFTPFAACTAAEPCAWANTAGTWPTNRLQNGVQAFYLVSRFHDHLASARIGFNAASGNFERAGGDPVLTQTLDGASTGPGRLPPQQRQYVDAARRVRADDADVPVPRQRLADRSRLPQHERRRRLRRRVARVHARPLQPPRDQRGRHRRPQQRARRRDGRGWSDWYASDLQVRDGLKTDTATPGQIDIGDYSDADLHKLRSQALDCPVNTAVLACPGGADTGAADIRSATSARSPAPRRSTSTARSGPRRCGTCARRSAPTTAREARDHRHAALAARAVDARHAQRDPGRRAGQRRRAPRRGVGGVPHARHGLLRRRDGRRRHGAG